MNLSIKTKLFVTDDLRKTWFEDAFPLIQYWISTQRDCFIKIKRRKILIDSVPFTGFSNFTYPSILIHNRSSFIKLETIIKDSFKEMNCNVYYYYYYRKNGIVNYYKKKICKNHLK